MRPCILYIVLLIGVLPGISHAQQTKATKSFLLPVQPTILWEGQSEGFGRTVEQAEIAARLRAHDAIIEKLRQERPSLTWKPDVAYLVDKGVFHRAKPPEEVQMSTNVYQKVVLEWKITQAVLDDMEKKDRASHKDARQALWGKLLIALVTVFGLSAAYLRLEERTKGYFTQILRTVLILGIALTIAALWYFL